ncbi:hypothetical protein HC341_08305 [Aquisalimonas sp. 2447]|uniref:hypothetical protein n=1 Tax=Aquisalimonas sp. 2447 TaxID=2740807 RepID=UPI0014327025|nr:hypothetical protein [Aquisalimonas sp. 2447]QIT55213.1 hypothetical protein HC341_08305 [Aquisalimonas sp. 2447]
MAITLNESKPPVGEKPVDGVGLPARGLDRASDLHGTSQMRDDNIDVLECLGPNGAGLPGVLHADAAIQAAIHRQIPDGEVHDTTRFVEALVDLAALELRPAHQHLVGDGVAR